MTTIPKPGDRVLVPATVESPGHDDEHIIVKVGGTPVQVATSAVRPPTGDELAGIRKQAQRYLEARYGQSVWYRAPETFDNTLERWIWAVASDAPPLAEECMSAIEQHFREGLTR